MKNTNDYLKQIFANLNKLGWAGEEKRKEVLIAWSNDKYNSHADIVNNANDADNYLKYLQKKVASRNKMGRGCLYLLRLIGIINVEDVNQKIQNIGTRNPHKKELWKLSYEEMYEVYTQLQMWHKNDTISKLKP